MDHETMYGMASKVKAGASGDAVAYEVDMQPEEIRAALARSDGLVMVTTRQGTQFAVTGSTLIEALEE